ncbi:MAG: ribosomal protein S18-alanine N-acetyltransferase [Syntrophorhabdaceae bacterium]
MILRSMTTDDIGPVLEIERLSFIAPWTEGMFRQTLASPITKSLTLTFDDITVGYIIFYHAGIEMHIMNIAVHPSYRRRGIGFEMMSRILGIARQYSVEECFLEVRESNMSARRLYEKIGFTPAGRRKGYYTETNEDAIVMKLSL